MSNTTPWPNLSIAEWKDTCATLHMWTQIVGKIRTVQMPWTNHSWHCTFYVTPRGLTTLAMPHGQQTFQIDFDFVDHRVNIYSSDGRSGTIDLVPMSVAEFYLRLLHLLQELNLPVKIHGKPNEVEPSIPFEKDTEHASYQAEPVARFHQALVQTERVMQQFRAGFRGKCSPGHFLWGSFDLAVTRFSGRVAPQHPGGFPNMPDWITREAYSHEVSSCGFWPGGGDNEAFFYSYAYPEPDGFGQASIKPKAADYPKEMGEFVLPYEAVRNSSTPDEDLLAFFESTYEAAAKNAKWDRDALEWTGPTRS
ncbi:MAG: DUF5996 family protein [Gemmataceae bacterium]